jgi:hypothetical protein
LHYDAPISDFHDGHRLVGPLFSGGRSCREDFAMSTRNSPANAASGHAGRPQRSVGLSSDPTEDDDWDERDPHREDEIWQPAPFDFDGEEEPDSEPDPEPGDFWLDPDDNHDD